MLDPVSLLLALILLIVPLVIYLPSYLKWKKVADIINKIPGPEYIPIFGTNFELMLKKREDIFNFFEHRTRRYGPVFRTWMGSIPEVHLMQPEHIEIILRSSVNIEKGHIYDLTHDWLGRGLLTSTGKLWHTRRKLLTPAFHFKILDDFVDVFVEKSQKLVVKLREKCNDDYFDIYPYINSCALDIICETAMGVQVNAMEQIMEHTNTIKSSKGYVSAVLNMSILIIQRAFRPWLRNKNILKRTSLGKEYFGALSILHNFTNNVIKQRKHLFNNRDSKDKTDEEDTLLGKKKRVAFLDLLLQVSDNGNVLTDTDIREEVDTFMFEGHDTTTVAICWCLFLLGNHPDIQEKVNEELYSIFEGEDRPITIADLGEMKYLERVIKESLRLYPSVPFISRRVTQSVTIEDYVIPEGCTVALHMYDVHRDPRHFPNPLQFDPDNFLPEACQKRHPFAYIPFSAGPRNCIGQKFALMEEKTLVASIIRKFKVTSLVKPEEMKVFAELILRPQDGIKVRLEPRY